MKPSRSLLVFLNVIAVLAAIAVAVSFLCAVELVVVACGGTSWLVKP